MGRYKYLTEYVGKTNSKTIIEVGTWNGYHGSRMIQAAGDDRSVTYYGFDLFEDMDKDTFELEVSKWPPPKSEVETLLSNTGANINLYQGNTRDTLPEFVKNNKDLKVDFIFMDGGHSFETIESDWNSLKELVSGTTTVLFDDYNKYTDGSETDFGSNIIVDGLDREKWNVEILPTYDQFDRRQVHMALVKKNVFTW